MENKIWHRIVGIVFGVTMLLAIAFQAIVMVTPCEVEALDIASAQGGSTNWYFTVYDTNGKIVNNDCEISLYDEDFDDIFDDKSIDSSGSVNITGLKEGKEYVLLISSEDHEYHSEWVHVTLSATAGDNSTLPKAVFLEDYWEISPYYWATSAGLFGVGIVLCCVGVACLVFFKAGQDSKPKKRKRR